MPRVRRGGTLASIFYPALRGFRLNKWLSGEGWDDRHVKQFAGNLKRPSALSGYASDSEFSVCRCGNNMWSNRVKLDKPIDPGLLLRRPNAWSPLRPDS